MSHRQNAYVIIALGLIGLSLSAWLTYLHLALHLDPSYVSVCALNRTVNCETVAASRYAVFYGVPVSIIGAIFYLVVLAIGVVAVKQPSSPRHPALLVLLSGGGVAATLVLGALSLFVIKAVCMACLLTYGVNFTLFSAALVRARRFGGLTACARQEIGDLKKDRWPVICALLLIILFIIAGPGGAFPRYTELAAWRGGVSLPHGIGRDGLPWIGAVNPTMVIHEYFDYECPSCRMSHRKLRRILAEHKDMIRIVRHDISRIPCIEPPGTKTDTGRCSSARAGRCAAAERRFWDWTDAVNTRPRMATGLKRIDYESEMAKDLHFDVKPFMACIADPATIAEVQREYAKSWKAGIRATPTYIVDGKKMYLKELAKLIEDRF